MINTKKSKKVTIYNMIKGDVPQSSSQKKTRLHCCKKVSKTLALKAAMRKVMIQQPNAAKVI